MSPQPKDFPLVSLLLWVLACSIAGGAIASTSSYNGANFYLAALAASPVYLFGLIAAINHLRQLSCRSISGWIVFFLNGVPLLFSVYVLVELFTS
jgi:hypothetical protein